MARGTGFSWIVVSAVILCACGRPVPSATADVSPSAGARPPTGPRIVAFDAIGDNTAWVVTDRALLITSDNGLTWGSVPAANVEGIRAMLALTPQHIVLAGLSSPNSADVVVRISVDGGQKWQESRLQPQGQPGDVRLAAGDGLLAALVVQTTSSNFSEADLFVSRDGGAFEERPAPAAGMLSITGANDVWLAGGVIGNQLWRSADSGRTWSEVPLSSQLGTAIGVSAPRRIADHLVLPVTINGPATQEAWLISSDDGATWQQTARVLVGGDSGAGVALSPSTAGDRVVVAGFAGAGGLFAVTASGGSVSPVLPDDLPVGLTTLHFTSATAGWASVVQSGCLSFKTQCFETTRLFATTDGGRTWREAHLPA